MADNNTQQFLPEGTNAVLRNKKTGESQWYTTKKELVFDSIEPGFTQCPKTNTRVRFVTQGNYDLLFPQSLIRSRIVVTDDDVDQDTLNKIKPVMFFYDIPDRSTMPNPSPTLRRMGFRLNLSCWVLDEGDVPYNMIAEMLDRGCNPHVLKFDNAELPKLVKIAIQSMRMEVEKAARSAAQRMARADTQLDGASEEGITAEQAAERYLARAEAVQETLDDLSDDLGVVADRFGIARHVLRIDRLSTTAAAIQTTMATRAKLYQEAAKKAAELGTAGQAIAEAIKADAIPAEIVADFLEDHEDEDGAGDALRAAFTAPTDADTFDLDSGDDEVTPAA